MYQPNPSQANSIEELRRYLEEELQKVANVLSEFEPDSIRLKVHTAVPDKPAQGQMYYADGTKWNPGYGEGPYIYNANGVWLPQFSLTSAAAHRPASTTLTLTSFAPTVISTQIVRQIPSTTLTLTGIAPA